MYIREWGNGKSHYRQSGPVGLVHWERHMTRRHVELGVPALSSPSPHGAPAWEFDSSCSRNQIDFLSLPRASSFHATPSLQKQYCPRAIQPQFLYVHTHTHSRLSSGPLLLTRAIINSLIRADTLGAHTLESESHPLSNLTSANGASIMYNYTLPRSALSIFTETLSLHIISTLREVIILGFQREKNILAFSLLLRVNRLDLDGERESSFDRQNHLSNGKLKGRDVKCYCLFILPVQQFVWKPSCEEQFNVNLMVVQSVSLRK